MFGRGGSHPGTDAPQSDHYPDLCAGALCEIVCAGAEPQGKHPNRRRSPRAILTPDGQEGVRVSAGDEIIVSQSPYVTRLIRIKGRSVYEIIRDKLNFDYTDY